MTGEKIQQKEYQIRGNIVEQEIRKGIETGKYKPGDKIRENDLCKQYGVSRTPVRETFRLLEKEGLLVHIPQCGVQVAKFGYMELVSCLEIRTQLECLSAKKAAFKVTKDQIARLRDINNQITNYDKDDPHRTSVLDEEFHSMIAQIGDNTYIPEFLNNILGKYRVMMYFMPFKQERIPYTFKEHEDIINALEQQDSILAEKYMEIHFHYSKLSIMKKMHNYIEVQKSIKI